MAPSRILNFVIAKAFPVRWRPQQKELQKHIHCLTLLIANALSSLSLAPKGCLPARGTNFISVPAPGRYSCLPMVAMHG